MNRTLVLLLAGALVAPAVFAQQQQQPQRDTTADMMRRHQESLTRQAGNETRQLAWGDHQAWLNSVANLAKLRAKLADAWQGMGMSPQGAKVVADAYDPELASHMHHASLRGKSDQEIAQMLQSELKDKHYLNADQLLIDYQRQKLQLTASAAPEEIH